MELEYKSFTSWDDTSIVYRAWNVAPKTKGIIILLHRGHEHSIRMESMAAFFSQDNYTVYAWDARGNGLSEGPRDDAENFSVFSRDLQLFVERIKEETERDTDQMLIVASSMGAVIATSWVHDYAPNIRGLILATPAFNIRLYMPLAIPLLKIARKLSLMPRVTSYVKSKVLTHDRSQQKIYNEDPLISGGISTDLLIDTYETGQRLIDDAGAISTPTLVLCAGYDWVVSRRAQRKFFERLSSVKKEWDYYPQCFHALFHEDNKETIFNRCKTFADDCFAAPAHIDNFDNANQYGYSKDKMDAATFPSINPSYPLTKITLNTLGKMSNGISIGLKQGFDSGKSLDNVYMNQATGYTPIGKIIDRIYLNSPGWQGIRYRKKIISHLLEKYIDASCSVNLLDIASGNGHYLFDLMDKLPLVKIEMRDFDALNVQLMNLKIAQKGCDTRASAVQADAFSLDSYQAPLSYEVAISSGIFELFPDNHLVTSAIKGVIKQLAPGGYFIYTNQPWHPQQTLIAKTLTNHLGQPWVMRCRSQAEMDSLVIACGFKKIEMQIDPSGIFSVSIAQKC